MIESKLDLASASSFYVRDHYDIMRLCNGQVGLDYRVSKLRSKSSVIFVLEVTASGLLGSSLKYLDADVTVRVYTLCVQCNQSKVETPLSIWCTCVSHSPKSAQ